MSQWNLLDIREMVSVVKIPHAPALVTESGARDILRRPAKAFAIPVVEPNSKPSSLPIRDAYDVCFPITIPVTDVEGSAIETSCKAY